MRDDLLDAQAGIDWTESKLPAFGDLLQTWINDNVHVVIEDTEPPATHNVAVAVESTPMPLAFNVEAGAYINVVRSSLDILVAALAARSGKSSARTQFPIFRSDLDFLDPLCGIESVKWLSAGDRGIIKSLAPYPGGNDTLWFLHRLDIDRKHRRLLGVRLAPLVVRVSGWSLKDGDVRFPANFEVVSNSRTVIALIAKDAARSRVHLTAHVGLAESGRLGRIPVIQALGEFTSLAASIIKLFDAP
jgi:hypothetical protein